MEILKTATHSSIRPTAQNFSIKDFFSKYDQIRWGNYSGELLTYNNDKAENFSEKDLSLISYLRGCVLEIFYRTICCPTKTPACIASIVCHFEMAGKCVDENVTLPQQEHVNVMDHGIIIYFVLEFHV